MANLKKLLFGYLYYLHFELTHSTHTIRLLGKLTLKPET